MDYILKSILCSILFLLIYKILLERETMFVFNRFYLLMSLGASLAIPLLTIELDNSEVIPATEVVYRLTGNEVNRPLITVEKQAVTFEQYAWLVYALVTGILGIRFLKNVLAVVWKIRKAMVIRDSVKIVLLDEDELPYSFMNYVFVSKRSYQKQEIEAQIWQHELAHIRQRHTWDILFMELVQVCWWFNPAVYVYQKMIRMNHEYLADHAVLSIDPEVKKYQRLLVSKVSQGLFLTSSFNYVTTKKRLLMMTKMTSKFRTVIMQLSMLPLLGISILLFGNVEHTIAQTKPAKQPTFERPSKQGEIDKVPGKEGVSDDLLKEYKAIVEKCFRKKDNRYVPKNFTNADEARLIVIYNQMNQQQRDQQDVVVRHVSPMKKESPTQKDLDIWKNPKTSGVWIDGKRVANSVLNNYKPEDFSYAMASRLSGKAKNPNYSYQIDLMTNRYFDEYVKEVTTKPIYLVRDRAWGKPNK
ncbi:hypothetical protein BWI93_12635 [Siphonobacter sp. BAB-5385]|uniref:M56 family metallopeptidase n=1 Tax=Siphonobacter sp. BAB-5385 TaxID=1864822 RepID=UPI000B9E2B3B|nr:M56 family metallopeptidase [Siphonobacter sp. BAB-5385]OZI07808.1 hypothetical protein BWI93_12635 [Siphonobacter sp. BAB-5385]